MLHADPLKTVAVHKEQRTDRQTDRQTDRHFRFYIYEVITESEVELIKMLSQSILYHMRRYICVLSKVDEDSA